MERLRAASLDMIEVNKKWSFNDFYCKLLKPSPAFDNRGRYEKCAKYWNSIDEAEQQGICQLIEAKLEAGEFVDPNPCFAMSDAMQEYEKRLAKAQKQPKKEPENLNMTSKFNQLERTTPLVSAAYKGTYGIFTLAQAEEFGLDQHRQLQAWCKEYGIEYSTSVWDVTSAKEITSLQPKLIKIPSACNLNKAMLEYLCENFAGEIHLSFGMTTKAEEEQIIRFFEERRRNQDLVVYNCTSGYPVPFEDICLLELKRMREMYADRVKAIGFSGHHLGIAVDAAAVALGAEWVERHFTLDRTWKGTDHAASLEPDGVRKLARDCRAVAKALTYKQEEVLPIEQVQRNKLKKNQIKW